MLHLGVTKGFGHGFSLGCSGFAVKGGESTRPSVQFLVWFRAHLSGGTIGHHPPFSFFIPAGSTTYMTEPLARRGWGGQSGGRGASRDAGGTARLKPGKAKNKKAPTFSTRLKPHPPASTTRHGCGNRRYSCILSAQLGGTRAIGECRNWTKLIDMSCADRSSGRSEAGEGWLAAVRAPVCPSARDTGSLRTARSRARRTGSGPFAWLPRPRAYTPAHAARRAGLR